MQSELEEKSEKIRAFLESLAEIELAKQCLVRAVEDIGGEIKSEYWEIGGVKSVFKLASIVESKISQYQSGKNRAFSDEGGEIESIKRCLGRIIESIGGENYVEMRDDFENEVFEIGDFSVGVKEVKKLAIAAESMVSEYVEATEKEKSERIRVSSENLIEIKSIKETLNRVIEKISDENNEVMRDKIEFELIEENSDCSLGLQEVSKLVKSLESNVSEYKEAKSEKVKLFMDDFQRIKSAKEFLVRLHESFDKEKKLENEEPIDETETRFGEECEEISNLVTMIELKLGEYRVMREKEKQELETSVVSLTEENRDINTLLRVALVEKEAVERRLKGNNESKRAAIWGLPRVGFGFMMGTSEQSSDNSSVKSDNSESEEEVVSLASTVERMMKNLRLEITQLRRSMEESRSDAERLQSLAEKQAHIISENEFYIKELEDRERMLAQNVEELVVEMKQSEEEVARWREACELEVEAGKSALEERDKLVFILKQELEKTKAALDIANGKLKLKDDLANAAMAAQAAAERSLQLTDSRVSVLNARVEELTKQLEEAENKDRVRRKVRHICWPFRRNNGARNFKRMLPEMQALLR